MGRLLAIDFGKSRLGLAICDSQRRIASPLQTWTRKNANEEARFFQNLTRTEEIVGLVVGLPVHLSGREGQSARAARQFGHWLHQATGLPVVFFDERFSTVEAESALWAAGLTHKRRRARRDQLAAQIVLQTYLDAGCPADNVPGPLEEA